MVIKLNALTQAVARNKKRVVEAPAPEIEMPRVEISVPIPEEKIFKIGLKERIKSWLRSIKDRLINAR